jgi:hypothetical protein
VANCIGCRYFCPDKPNKGKGECWQQPMTKTGTEKLTGLDALKHTCKKWTLLCMGQVKGRSSRRFVWDANQNVSLR